LTHGLNQAVDSLRCLAQPSREGWNASIQLAH
jgi:hypothetical protein